jgi:hypothetical protein
MLVFIITTLGLGLLCSIPGFLIGRYLTAKGIARDGPVWEIVSNICGLLIARLVLPDVPLIYIVAFFLVLSPFGVYRHDLWTTFRSGRWWWLKEDHERQPLFSLPVSIILSLGIGVLLLVLLFGTWMLIIKLS